MNIKKQSGFVYLIGAGPGDAGLISVKGMEILKKSDVVIYDYLVNERLLNYCPDKCEKIYAGKKAKNHTLTQEEINKLLLKKTQKNKIITRLKGGDPFVFGRGGEEALYLSRNNIDFEIIPGITASIAASAYAGIPFTHRGLASTAVMITGHEDPTKENGRIEWEHIAKISGTLSFYMGINNLEMIANKLIEFGKPKDTPAAIIRWGTLNGQETFTGKLGTIAETAKDKNITAPAIIIIGKTVNLRDELRWFDKRPLFGIHIIVTRSRHQISKLTRKLEELGADVIELPTIEIEPIKNNSQLKKSFKNINNFSWIIFTSENSVNIFFENLLKTDHDVRILKGIKIVVIGRETGEALLRFGIKADFIPDRYTSEGIIEKFQTLTLNLDKQEVLIPGSEIAGSCLPDSLRKMGAKVTTITLYKNKTPEYEKKRINEIFKRKIDLVTFTSSSTVSNFFDIIKAADNLELLKEITGASIGPITSKTACEYGIKIGLEACTHTIECLVETIKDYFIKGKNK